MSLDKVVDDILKKGEEKKQEILQTGRKERDDQVALADKRIAEERAMDERKTKAAIAQMEQQELSSAELESKRISLAAQRTSMDVLKKQVLEEIARLPNDKRKVMYSKLVSKAKKELGECVVYFNKADKPLLQLPSGMSVGGPIECVGGLVFESKDRSIRLDYRFESMLEDVWNRKMREIYGKLFG
jgi:V/A-type H+-transporting ATPase subunit E